MASFDVILKRSAERDLRSLPPAMVRRVVERVEALAEEPFPPQTVRLSGTQSLYRVRVGDYRVVYEVRTVTRQIVIHYVRHRREVYRRL